MAGTAFPVTLLFADGVSQRIAVPCGGKLIEAAQEAGLNLLTKPFTFNALGAKLRELLDA